MSSAARPWKLAPYPTLVGTATTGLATRPPTTDGRTPSMPAATTMTLAASRAPRASRIRCNPATPTSYRVSTRLPRIAAVTADSSATGMSEVPAETTSTRPTGRGGRGAADDDGAAQRMIHSPRGGSLHGSEHLGGGAGREEGAVALHDALRDGGDLLDRLPFAEDHLREPLAQGAMVIHPGEAHVLVGQMAELLRRLFGRDLVGANVSQELQERLAIHTSFRRGLDSVGERGP